MARPLRIEYPDAWYHVMNRGRRGEDIFSDDQGYILFTELLAEEDELSKAIGGVKWPVCLGSQEFIDRIKEKYGVKKIHREIPSSRELLPDTKRIVEAVCKFYGVSHIEIMKTYRGRINEARNASVYLTRRLRMDTFKRIGEQYGIENDRTVRSVCERMKNRLRKDRDLRLKMEKIKDLIK